MRTNNGWQVVIGLGLLAAAFGKAGSGGGAGGGGGRGGADIGTTTRGDIVASSVTSSNVKNTDTRTLIAAARNLSSQAFVEMGRRPRARNMNVRMESTATFDNITNAQSIIHNELAARGVPLSVI